MVSWPLLQQGDIVDLIAPSSKYVGDAQARFFKEAPRFIESLGLHPRYDKNLFGADEFYSNTTQVRARITAEALLAPDSKVVMAARGGYGCNIVLPLINEQLPDIMPHTKLVIGFSDITALHSYLISRYDWPTFHWEGLRAVMQNVVDQACIKMLKCGMFGDTESFSYELKPLNDRCEDIDGVVITGGNMSLVQASVGTFWECKKQGIIFLEDVNETAVRVDRALHHLWQANVFKNARAILFGDFTFEQCANPAREAAMMQAVVGCFANEIDIPVFSTQNVGHTPRSRPVPLNTMVSIKNSAADGWIMEVAVR